VASASNDLVVEHLALSELELHERLRATTDQRDDYRLMTQVTLALLHDAKTRLDRERESRQQLLDELRRLRAHLLEQVA
jgi:hypothetical protein